MESFISPVVADIFMAYVEDMYQHFTYHLLWIYFVDDTFCVREFHDHLDDISSFIMFTYELEMDGRLPCLDVHDTRSHIGALTTTIYHKPTHTNRHLTIHLTASENWLD